MTPVKLQLHRVAQPSPLSRALPISSLASPANERMIRAYLGALTGDDDAINDLSQEVFLRAIERLDLLTASPDPNRTLRGIARRVALEFFRVRRRSRRYIHVTMTTLADDDLCVAEAVQQSESAERLRHAMEELPIVSRRMLEMRYHDGLSAPEIGERLGISRGAVRVTLLRIRERLRSRLETTELAVA